MKYQDRPVGYLTVGKFKEVLNRCNDDMMVVIPSRESENRYEVLMDNEVTGGVEAYNRNGNLYIYGDDGEVVEVFVVGD